MAQTKSPSSPSRMLKWMGRRLAQSVANKPGEYTFLKPPSSFEQAVKNNQTGAVLNYRIRDKNDLSIAKQIFQEEHYNIDVMPRADEIRDEYASILAAGKTPLIIDCGGNIGMSAKYFADHYPKAKIVVIEPGDDNFALLSENCFEPSIIPVHAAIAGSTRTGKAVDVGRGNCGLMVEDDPDGGLLFITIGDILAEHGSGDIVPFILKVDVEGFEEDVFGGDTSWLDEFYLLAIELHDWMLPCEARSGNFLRAIAPLNRDFVSIGEIIFSIANRGD